MFKASLVTETFCVWLTLACTMEHIHVNIELPGRCHQHLGGQHDLQSSKNRNLPKTEIPQHIYTSPQYRYMYLEIQVGIFNTNLYI